MYNTYKKHWLESAEISCKHNL